MIESTSSAIYASGTGISSKSTPEAVAIYLKVEEKWVY